MNSKTPHPPASLKKKRLLALVATLAVIALLVFLNTLDFSSPSPSSDETTVYTPDTYPEVVFYEPDYETDILTLPDYLALDRTIAYTYGGQTEQISESLLPESTFPAFFLAYFEALQKGYDGIDDADSFDRFYSDVYFRKHTSFSAFTPQKVYDIEIERVSEPQTINTAESEADKPYIGSTLTRFEVRYKIYQNDGTFRRDIVDAEVSPQTVTLLCDKKGNVTINSVVYPHPTTVTPVDTVDSSILPYLMPLVWLILTLVLFALAFILKKKVLLLAALSLFVTFLVSIKASLLIQFLVAIPLTALLVAAYFLLPRIRKR